MTVCAGIYGNQPRMIYAFWCDSFVLPIPSSRAKGSILISEQRIVQERLPLESRSFLPYYSE